MGGVLAPSGAMGAAKVASEAPKCSQGDCQGRLGLEKACIRGPKDVQEEPRVYSKDFWFQNDVSMTSPKASF